MPATASWIIVLNVLPISCFGEDYIIPTDLVVSLEIDRIIVPTIGFFSFVLICYIMISIYICFTFQI